MSVEIAVLGSVEVRVGGRTVHLGGARQRVVLARLALNPGRLVSLTALLDDLWGENPPTSAKGNLRSYVSRLRSVVGQQTVATSAGGYRLNVAPDDIDVGRAERLVAEANAIADADANAAVELLSAALALWRGEPLADLPERLSFAADLARLREWRLQLLERRGELQLHAGLLSEAVPELASLVELEPTREHLYLLLMRALHQSGRTSDALAAGNRYRRRLAEETGLDPSAELARLEQRLRIGDPDLSPAEPRAPRRPPPHPRATRATGDLFVGRRRELDRLEKALAACRLVTVTGPGGMGKSRLVFELLERWSQVMVFVSELAAISDADGVASALAGSVGLQSAPEGMIQAVAERLGTAEALLVLDNCEHVIGAVREITGQLLRRCPGVRVVATSRRRLGIPGEVVIRLGSLSEEEQVALFRDRAGLLRSDFEAAADDVLAVCRLLDGLPLAVELAAHREAAFGMRQLAERLSAGLLVLEPSAGGDRTTALTATAEWSYRLLEPLARTMFDRLAVCRGGFGLDALEYLAPPDCANPAALLAELVDASLVVVDLSVDPPRYRVLEPMRQAGAGHLDPVALTRARDSHALWMQRYADELEALVVRRSPTAAAVLGVELANLRAAVSWLTDCGRWDRASELAIPLAIALSDAIAVELLGPLARFDEAPWSPSEIVGPCTVVAGAARWLLGKASAAEDPLTAALEHLPEGHDRRWVALFFRSMSRMYSGDVTGVGADTAALLEDPGTPAWVAATSVCNAAMVHLFAGDRNGGEVWLRKYDDLLAGIAPIDGFIACTHGEFAAAHHPEEALVLFDRAYRQCGAAGHTFNQQVAAVGRAAVLIRIGRQPEAVTACVEAIVTLRTAGMWPQLWTVLRLSAELLVSLGDLESAAALLSSADADQFAPSVIGADAARQEQLWAQIASAVPGNRYQQESSAGVAMGRVEAAELALRALAQHA